MTPAYKIPGIPLAFKRVLRLTEVDGVFDNEPIVRYAEYDPDLGRELSGVAIVVRGGEKVLHCSAFNNEAFAQVWLYASRGYLNKQRRNSKKALEALVKGGTIEIYMASSDNPKSMAAAINAKLKPSWD